MARRAATLRWIAIACALLISCAHTAGGGPVTVHDDVLGTLRRCPATVAAVEPDRVVTGAIGERLAVRGVLVPDAALSSCTMKACREVDRAHQRSRSVACCNWCSAGLTLRPLRDAPERDAATTKVRAQLRGQSRALDAAVMDCELAASLARAHPEVVVTGGIRSALTETGAPIRVLDEAELCATGNWSDARPAPPRPPDGPWHPDRSSPIDLGPIDRPAAGTQ